MHKKQLHCSSSKNNGKKNRHTLFCFFVQQLQSLSCLCLNLEIVFNMSSTRYIYLGRILPTKCVAPSQRNSSSPVIVSSDWEKNGIALSGRQYMKNKTNKSYVGFSIIQKYNRFSSVSLNYKPLVSKRVYKQYT